MVLTMPGGVFVEDQKGAHTHYVIVSDANYFRMLSFARLQATLTATTSQTYGIVGNNCVDFVYQIFQHSDLPPKYHAIPRYLADKREPVAIYADVLYGGPLTEVDLRTRTWDHTIPVF